MMPEDQLKYGLVHEIVDNVFDILIWRRV
jgi:hypothetical protein